MRVLKNIEPIDVFTFFEDITRIPRCSGNEKQISDYCVNFAKERNLTVIQDEFLNCIIKKPGTIGYENAPTVILQAHLDMVCEKNRDSNHVFGNDPLKLYIDGDYIKADKTTLGADNGIGIAYGLAVLNSKNIPHPPLEVVFTANEEVGMDGAAGLSPENLSGEILINMDSEEEGIFCSSCAGGMKQSISIDIDYIETENDYECYSLLISGLKGGHSGMDIDKERGNANLLAARSLYELDKSFDIYLKSINGGSKDNAIPREAEIIIYVKKEESAEFLKKVDDLEKIFVHEYEISDPNIKITTNKINTDNKVFSKPTTANIITALFLLPNGIQSMSTSIQGLVESSNNIGVVKTISNEKKVTITSAVRSSVVSRKYFMQAQIEKVAELIGAETELRGDYPPWEYNKDSAIRDLFVKTYKEIYGKEAEIAAIHAGLECGLFAEKIKNLDMISFGPDMYDVHTPDEKVSISSVKRMYEFLLAILSKIA